MQQHPRRVPARTRTDTGKNWPYVIYARVMLQMLEDLERSRTPEQATALEWFSKEPYEVAIVCAVCLLKPRDVYREVARRLRAEGIRSRQRRQISFIRWQLRSGKKLSEITVPLAEPCKLLAA